MKKQTMAEFLQLPDEEKVRRMEELGEGHYGEITSDKGKCRQCGGEADAGDYCFGCHDLICSSCIEKEPHLSRCFESPLTK